MQETPKTRQKKKTKKAKESSGPPILKAQLVLIRNKREIAETLLVMHLELRPDGSRPLIPDINRAIAERLGIPLDTPAP